MQPVPSPTSPVTQTSKWYLPGGDLLLLVREPVLTYIRIPSYFVQDSDFLKIKSVSGSQAEPLHPGIERAIVINGDEATVEEMESLCWVWLNPLFDDYSRATLSEWFSILRLASMWNIRPVKQLAFKYINRMINEEIPTLVGKIIKFEENVPLPEALVPLYTELCTRDAGLSDEEWDLLETLPEKRIRRIIRARERLSRHGGSLPSETELRTEVARELGLVEAPALAPESSSTPSGSIAPQPSNDSSTSQINGSGGGGGGGRGNRGSTGGGAEANRGSSNARTTTAPSGGPGNRA